MTIAVDFDGTIVEHRYPRIGKEIPASEMDRVNQMIEDISYYNAKNFFKF